MCNQCLINDVKKNMLSRRNLFKQTAAGAVLASSLSLSHQPAMASGLRQVIDLTHSYDAQFPTYSGEAGFSAEEIVHFEESGYQLKMLTIEEHTGTHIDAPLHFSADGASVDEIMPQNLICPLCVVDIATRAQEDPNTMLEAEDIEQWQSLYGQIPVGACVALYSGWAAKINDPSYRNTPDLKLAFPGFSQTATDLLEEMGVVAIGVDTLSLDPGNSQDFAVHYSWLPSGHYGIENLANLDQIPAKGATIFVGAPKHRGGTGGPARILAMI